MERSTVQPWRLLSGSALKWFAIVTMFVDHLGATVIWALAEQNGYSQGWIEGYYLCRMVGRLAFPIFCFLLAEGFYHTRSRGRYALRLAAFALVSEIPFDIAFQSPANGFLELYNQNVFFTLLIGLLALWLWDWLAERIPLWAGLLLTVPAAALGFWAAELLGTDYGGYGVLIIFAMGAAWQLMDGPARPEALAPRLVEVAAGALALLYYCLSQYNTLELYALPSFALMLLYSGRRGRGGKWFFYWFYPVHLLLLGLIARLL